MVRKNACCLSRVGKTMPLLLITIVIGLSSPAQCDIRNRIAPDGTMYYFLDAARFYYSSEKQLAGGLVTDKEHYFLTLLPAPFPERRLALKLKDPASVTLANGKEYKLDNFSSRFNKDDSAFTMMFLVPPDVLEDFRKHDIESVTLNMGKREGSRTYQFSLHKSAFREHLACFLDKKKD